MLQGGSEAHILQHGPDRQLVHGRGVLRPYGEPLAVGRVGFLQPFDCRAVFEKQNGSVPGSETAVDLGFRTGESLGRDDFAQRLFRYLP